VQPSIAPVLVAAAGVFVTTAVAVTAAGGLIQPSIAVAFGLMIAIGELVRITLPGERETAPIGAAGALAYALLPAIGTQTAEHGALQVVAVTAAGMALGLLPHALAGRSPSIDYPARRILTVGFAALLFRPIYVDLPPAVLVRGVALTAFVVVVAVLATFADALLAAAMRRSRLGTPLGPAFQNELRALAGISSAIGATGILVALATGVMGLWAIPVLSVPLLLAQFSFRRYSSIRSTYLQTIRALARVTELGGYTETGHAERVARLATAVGKELGISDAELYDLEYAALMHDIGQLSLTDPIPGGVTVILPDSEQRRIARLGAEVIRQAKALDSVAYIVERHADTYRGPDGEPDPTLPLASRIIRVVNAYDDLASNVADPAGRARVLERLRMSAVFELDPHVVESLTRILDRTVVYV
jgi:HD domain